MAPVCRVVVAAALLALGACARSSSVTCDEGVCAEGTRCGPGGACVPLTCGDGVVQAREACDGVPAVDCRALGYYEPAGLACTEACTLDASACQERCGDGATNGPEACDGAPPAGQSCASFGRDRGPLACAGSCTVDLQDCGRLGWVSAPSGATARLSALWGTGPDHLFAVGEQGQLLQRVAGVWTPRPSPTTHLLVDITGTAPDRMYLLAVEAATLRPHIYAYDGAAWAEQPLPADTPELGAIDAAAGAVVAAGSGATVLELVGGAWQRAVVEGSTTRRFAAVDAAAGLAVGSSGAIYHRTAAGWAPLPGAPATTATLEAVAARGGRILIAGTAGTVLRFDGATWTTATAPVIPPRIDPVVLRAAWLGPDGTGYVSGDAGQVLRLDGATFLDLATGASRGVIGVIGFDDGSLFALTNAEFLELTSPARRRSTFPTPEALTVTAVGHVEGTAVAANAGGLGAGPTGQLFTRTAALGNAWELGPAGYARGAVTALWSDGPHVAIGSQALFYGPAGLGGAIAEVTTGLGQIYALAGRRGDLYAVGSPVGSATTGIIAHTTDPAGQAWQTEYTGGGPLRAVWAAPTGGVAIAVGDGGVILRRDATGVWTPQPSGVTRQLLGVWGTDASNVYAVGTVGTALRFDGVRWRDLELPTVESLRAVGGRSTADVYIVGAAGTMFHFDGAAWSPASVISATTQTSIHVTPEEVLVGADFGAVVELFALRTTTEARCGDGLDDDRDLDVDCADMECENDVACDRGGACRDARPLTCGATTTGTTLTGIARLDDLPCLPAVTRGTEATFRFVAPATGPATITLVGPDALALAVAPALHGACDLGRCTGAAPAAADRVITLDVVEGATYYVIVDGPAAVAGEIAVTLTCPG